MSKVYVIVSFDKDNRVFNDCSVCANKADAALEMEEIEADWEGDHVEVFENENGIMTTVQVYDEHFSVELVEREVQ